MKLVIRTIAVIAVLAMGSTLANAQYRPEDNPTNDPRKKQEIQVPSTNIKPEGQNPQSPQSPSDRVDGTTGSNPSQPGQDPRISRASGERPPACGCISAFVGLALNIRQQGV